MRPGETEPRSQDSCKQPWRNSASSTLPACAPAGSSGEIICPSGFADPAAGSGDLEPHLFAAHGAPLMRSVFADPHCLRVLPIRAGAGSSLNGW